MSQASLTVLAPGEPSTVVDLLVRCGLTASRSAARRAVQDGGVSANNRRIADENWVPGPEDLLHGRLLVLRRGRRTMAGIELPAGP